MLRRSIRISRRLLALATLATVALLGTTQDADADLVLYLQQDGVDEGSGVGAVTEIVRVAGGPGGAVVSPLIFTFGDFEIRVFTATSTEATSMSDLLTSSVRVQNKSSEARTLNLIAAQDGYSLPVGDPLSLVSGSSGTVTTGTLSLTGIFQAYADANNGLLVDGGSLPPPNTFSNGPQDAIQTGNTFDTGSATGLFSRSGDFSLTAVTTLTLSGGGVVNYDSTISVTAVPEPTTLAAAFTTLPLLGGLYLRRRMRRTV
jgi:hypothetical protein